MNIPIPQVVKSEGWDLLREFSENRLFLRDVPGIPSMVKPMLRESVKVGAIIAWLLGPDPKRSSI